MNHARITEILGKLKFDTSKLNILLFVKHCQANENTSNRMGELFAKDVFDKGPLSKNINSSYNSIMKIQKNGSQQAKYLYGLYTVKVIQRNT